MKRVLAKLISIGLATTLTVTCLPTASVVQSLPGMSQLAVLAEAATINAQAAGWNETAYAEWTPVSGASSYDVYVKKSGGSYTKIDSQLVRQYDGFWRADALGLAKGTYNLKVEAKNGSTTVATWESGNIAVTSFTRDGFGFSGGSSSGGYNDDGTLKSNALVFYVTDSNKDSITCDVVTNSKGTKTSCTGMGAIIKALEKGVETRPMVFRFIGQVKCPASEQNLNQLDIKKAKNPITIEGVGNDAFALFGFNLVGATNLEVRNIGFKDMTTKDEDGVTIKDASQYIWVHNCDFFYGGQGSDKDQAKGDGTVDLKGTSTKITVSENHYWDCGKVNLCGLGESADYEITYSRNWFDHSDSRHPRVRTGSIHIYNNYYDGVAKYGAGACTGSSLFVDSNYFRNTSKPVMSSMQGTDATGAGTFSKETGGIIKMYGNIMTGKYSFIEANLGNGKVEQNSDGYTVSNRTDKVPSSLTTVKGGTSYNNFDTIRNIGVSASGIMAASEVPAYVTTHAGRINGGNFKFTFDDSKDDADYAVNSAMTSALASYTYKADTSNVSSKSTTGVDGNTFYTARTDAYAAKVATLPDATQPSGSGSGSTGGGETGGGETGGGEVITNDLVLNASDVPNATYSAEKTGLGTNGAFSILANSSKTVIVDASKGIQLGGGGDVANKARIISVKVDKAATIYVTSVSSGTTERTLNVSDTSGNVLGTIATGASNGVKVPSAGTDYIYSAGSGINVSKVVVSYDSSTGGDTPVIPTIIKGDANDDGNVNNDDVKHIISYVIHKIDEINNADNADVTGDGEVSMADANRIKKFVDGLISSL